jgi:hypothetical protein
MTCKPNIYLSADSAQPFGFRTKDAFYPVQLIRIQRSTPKFKGADLKSADARQARQPALRDSECSSFGS